LLVGKKCSGGCLGLGWFEIGRGGAIMPDMETPDLS
jgi:hypothetical protein